MATTDQRALIAALQAQVSQLQEELASQAAQAGAAVAGAQERTQQLAHELSSARATIAAMDERQRWLEERQGLGRWRLELIEVSRRPRAGWLRAALRALRPLYRLVKRNGRQLSS